MVGFRLTTKVQEDIGIAKSGKRFPPQIAGGIGVAAGRTKLEGKLQKRSSWAEAIDANLELARVPCAV